VDGPLAQEARALLASARAWLAELVEEGVDGFERVAGIAVTARAEPAPPPSLGFASLRASLAGERSSQEPGWRPTLAQVREQLGECTRCRLCEGRTQIVFGDGDPQAALMFIGEGPGETEDLRGLPFVGRAGELLTQMIEKGLGIARREVYICNIVKCRPPGNRTPLTDEVASCRPFLDGQIDAVRPRVIVALGRVAAQSLLGTDAPVGRMRGEWHALLGVPLRVTYHPAAILRNAALKRPTWEDMQVVRDQLAGR